MNKFLIFNILSMLGVVLLVVGSAFISRKLIVPLVLFVVFYEFILWNMLRVNRFRKNVRKYKINRFQRWLLKLFFNEIAV